MGSLIRFLAPLLFNVIGRFGIVIIFVVFGRYGRRLWRRFWA